MTKFREKELLALKNLMGLTFEILEIKKKLLKVNCRNMFLLEKNFCFHRNSCYKIKQKLLVKKKKIVQFRLWKFLAST